MTLNRQIAVTSNNVNVKYFNKEESQQLKLKERQQKNLLDFSECQTTRNSSGPWTKPEKCQQRSMH